MAISLRSAWTIAQPSMHFYSVKTEAHCAALQRRDFLELKVDLHSDLRLLSCKDLATLPEDKMQVKSLHVRPKCLKTNIHIIW